MGCTAVTDNCNNNMWFRYPRVSNTLGYFVIPGSSTAAAVRYNEW